MTGLWTFAEPREPWAVGMLTISTMSTTVGGFVHVSMVSID